MEEPLHYKTITELSKLIKSKKLSPVEVTRAQLDRIERLDRKLKAYGTVAAEIALRTAMPARTSVAG